VFLGSIAAPQPPAFKPAAGETLEPNEANDLQPAIDHMSEMMRQSDIVANVLGLVYTGVFLTKPELSFLSMAQMAETLYVSWKAAKSVYDAAQGAAAANDVNIYGEGGVNVQSPVAIQLTTADLKSFASGDSTFTSGQYGTLQAGIGAKCFGGLKSTVEAGVYAEVKAGMSVSIASLRGQAEVRGKKIVVGRHLPDLAQAATQDMELKATKKIDIDSKKDVHVKSAEKTHVEAKKDIEVEAKDAVRIHVGSYCIEVKPDGIKIGKGKKGTPSDPVITVKGSNITLHSGSMDVKVGKNSVQMGNSSTYARVLDSGNVFVKGKIIKLG
jgi:hypothetical protein